MTIENQFVEQKSLRAVTQKSPDWKGLAKECVAFANARGGEVHIGFEDGEHLPPEDQTISNDLANKVQTQVRNVTYNVELISNVKTAKNGGQYICLKVPRSRAVASTSSGGYYYRVGDESRRLVGDEVTRLATDRPDLSWETRTTAKILRTTVDESKLKYIVSKLKSSENAKDSVKRKTPKQILEHFMLVEGKYLTNLGILCVGKRSDRAKLGVAPIIHCIKKDAAGIKVFKHVWDDHDLSPMELVDAVWEDIPDFREGYEIPNGMRRDLLPAYERDIVRELLVNALVHRPYTQKGDIYLNLFPDRLELVNPGLLPVGVTLQNILHKSERRNDYFAKLFHDIGFMEREGTGMIRLHDLLLSRGRPMPVLKEGDDSFSVTVHRQVPDLKVIDFIAKADNFLGLYPTERIVLGMLAKNGPATAQDMAKKLGMKSVAEIKEWMKRLLENEIVAGNGKTRAMRYSVTSDILSAGDSDEGSATSIVAHQDDYMTLVENDIYQNPRSRIAEIHERIGDGITRRQLRYALSSLVKSGRIVSEGVKRGTRYMTP